MGTISVRDISKWVDFVVLPLPGSYKEQITGWVVVREISAKLGDACLVIVTVLGMKLHVTIDMQEHQLTKTHRQKQNGMAFFFFIQIRF